jgi:N utilization substance protein B
MNKKSPRHLARSLAIQGLYFHKLNNTNLDEIEAFLSKNCFAIYPIANYELMHFLLEKSISKYDNMLSLYNSYLNRTIDEINLIEQIILVIAAVELNENLSVPAPVIINESVELAKLYGAEESYKFINGLVDKLARQLRA